MKRNCAVLLALAALAACTSDQTTSPRRLSPNSVNLRAVSQAERDWLSFQVMSPCNGEVIDASGPLHATTRSKNDGAGGLHISGHENAHFTGMGETGSSYVASLNSDFHLEAKPPYPMNTNTTFELNFIAKGKALNFGAHLNTHVTVNANGDITVDGGEIEGIAQCQDDRSKGDRGETP